MKTLLREDWATRYCDYISKLNFTNKELQEKFLKLLKSNSKTTRDQYWNNLKIDLVELADIWKLSNPYYIGFGNPDSDILFLGKEKGFDINKHIDYFYKESINNILHWEFYNKAPVSNTLLEKFGFDPMFPRSFHKHKLSKRHTWGIYSQIISNFYGLDQDVIFGETIDFNNSFFKHCFISEINHIPSKYSEGRKLLEERKDLLQNKFYKKFSKVIIGAKGYLKPIEIEEIFNTDGNLKKICLGSNKRNKIFAFKAKSKTQTIVYCNQLSGAAGWTNVAIENLVKEF